MSSTDESQKEWREKTLAYTQAVNDFVAKGMSDGWDNIGPEPEDNGREPLVPALLAAITQANKDGSLAQLRQQWPLAYSPLLPLLKEKGQSIPCLCLLDDGRVVARIGNAYGPGQVVEIAGTEVKVVEDESFFGRSPDRRYFAYCREGGVAITLGWRGEQVAFCPYPSGREGLPEDFGQLAVEAPTATQLVPFPDGRRVLFVSPGGIFVLSASEAVRLLPTQEAVIEHFTWLREEYPEDELSLDLAMEHGAVSADGKWIAVGAQDSSHLIFDDKLQLAADIGNQMDYPHWALFSQDSSLAAFNACHFYNGVTIGVSTALLPGLKTEPYEDNPKTPFLEEMSRVYAGCHRGHEFIIGDAYGYLRAFGNDGTPHWQHFIGSSIGDMDVSSDGRTLVCSTYAGFISIIQLDQGRAPYEIGTGNHSEVRRWLFWQGQAPLAW